MEVHGAGRPAKKAQDKASKLERSKVKKAKKEKSKAPLRREEEEEAEQEQEEASGANEANEANEEAQDSIPVAEAPKTQAKTFKELGLVDVLCEICDSLHFTTPTPIQAAAIPVALQERDVIGTAQTGSGKTLAFVLPIVQALLERPRPGFGLVLAPTRELAVQTGKTFEAFAGIALRSTVLVGGMDMVAQTIALGKRPHVVVATPGRLLDHLEKTKGFSLKQLRYLVIDEADRLLDMDFGPVLEKILRHLPGGDARRTMLFSATMSSKVESLQRASLRDPVRVSAGPSLSGPDAGATTVATLKQNMLLVPQMHKDATFVYLLNEFAGRTMIVFVRTVTDTQRLALLVRALGFAAMPMNGRLSQSQRLAALNKILSGARTILIATDVAARGLDIPNVSVVINYDVPQDSDTYIHRVGRTARAGKSGQAITLLTQYDFQIFMAIERAIGLERQIAPLPCDKDAVELFKPRVEEANRQARVEMRTLQESGRGSGRHGRGGRGGGRGGGRSGGRGRNDDMDLGEE